MGIIDFVRVMVLTVSSLSFDSSEQMAHHVVDAARSNELDPILLCSLVERESGWDVHARNPRVGAYGLTQLHPAFYPGRRTAWQQLYTGATVLRGFWDECGGPWRAVAAYRSGRCTTIGPQTHAVMKTYGKWLRRWKAVRAKAQ